MAFVSIKSKFHCALDGQGIILQGAPDRLAYDMKQAPVYGNRFASGDRSYNDLSAWWYLVQTDWTGGIKDAVSWADDAKYYYSTNIDAFSNNGEIKLDSGLALEKDFTEEIVCGSYEAPAGTAYSFVGTNPSGSTKPAIYRRTAANTWGNISSAFMPTTQQSVMDVMTHKGKLWFITMDVTSGGTYEVGYCDADGASPTDLSALTGSLAPRHVYCMDSDGATMYIGYRGAGGGQGAVIAKSTDNGANWTTVVNLGGGVRIVCLRVIGGSVYYLVTKPNGTELRKYDGSVDVQVWFFTGVDLGNSSYSILSNNDQSSVRGASISRKALLSFNGVLIITLYKEIWGLNLSSGVMTRLFKRDEKKRSIDYSSTGYTYDGDFLCLGGIVHDNKIYWGNLVYDGEYFYNGKRAFGDSAEISVHPNPVLSDGSSIFWNDNNDYTKLYVDSAYKGTADKNYLVFNNFDLLSGIDKLAYSLTILFKPLITGQSISVEYFIGELASDSTWTVLGTASFAVDAGVVTDKTFYFGAAVIFKKMWIRIKMAGGGSDTPTMNDLIMEYLPVPTFKKNWSLNINCGDEVKRLDGMLVETVGRELKGRLERAWWTKSILDFQDLDYATTLLSGALNNSATTITVDDTKDFPEQGRLHVDDEEIVYTGKTPTTFTGCTRGARSTRGVAHSDNAVINNSYKVILTDLSVRTPVALEDKELEYTVGLSLREV